MDDSSERRDHGLSTDGVDVDVLVVGAGPGGSAAAYHLARAGLDVLVVDRARFPRDKVCGDGLTPRAVAALIRMGVDVAEPGFGRIAGSRVRGADGRALDVGWPAGSSPGFGLVRRRFELDHLLVQRAVEAGAVLREATEAVGPIVEGARIVGATVRASRGVVNDDEEFASDTDPSGRTVRARFVVAADGVSGRLATLAGLSRHENAPIAVAARRYYRVETPLAPLFEACIGIERDGTWLPGYGWAFPTGDGEANVGAFVIRNGARRSLAARASPDVSARAALDAFLASGPEAGRFRAAGATSPVRSSAIPMGMDRRPAKLGLLVVGDAAGLANPFTGEGIGYAMESGERAARAIVMALAARDAARFDPAAWYTEALHRRYGRTFWAGRAFARQICRPTVTRLAANFSTRVPFASRAAIRFMIDPD